MGSVNILVENPLLALLIIMAFGLLLGRFKIFGFQLGVAAVLFVGLGLAAIQPGIQVPSMVYIIGLALFVYTIGLEAGPDFLRTLKAKGLRTNTLAIGGILIASGVTYGLVHLFKLNGVSGAGMFTGATTNTPAMAAIVNSLPSLVQDDAELQTLKSLPLVAYSLAYPLGVLIVILCVAIMAKVFRIDHTAEAEDAGVAVHELYTWRIRVDRDDLGQVIDLAADLGREIIVSRIERNGEQELAGPGTRVTRGDVLCVVGTVEELEATARQLGEVAPGDPFHGHDLDYRRIFVSNPDMVGIPLAKLRPHLSGMLITRVRRGDADMVATPDTVLQLGDRVRVVAPHERIGKVTRQMGDSYRRLSDVNLFPLVLGLTLGVLVGMIGIPLPGGSELKLGSAGGPLVVALALGAIGRTGKVVWQVPYGANLALRQLGITLFLAAIGTTAGAGFRDALSDPASLTIIGAGAIVTFAITMSVLVIGHKLFKLPYGETAGLVAGMQTHPAVLSYVSDLTRNDLPAMGYTAVYPISMIAKIIAAQMLLYLLI